MKSKLFLSLLMLSFCLSSLGASAQEADSLWSKSQIRRMEKIKARATITDDIVREKHHSLRIGYGATALFYRYRTYDPGEFSVQHYYRGNENSSGIVFAEYSYRPLRWLETGLHVGYINLSRQFYNRLDDQKIGHHSLNTLSFAAHVRFSYLTRPIVRLYSGLAIGATVGFEQMKIDNQIENYSSVFFNGSVTLFGVTVGRRLYGFAELSVGTMGILNFGVGYRFATK